MEQKYDRKGVPIYPGDLLKTFHFVGARRKRYYHYHVVVDRGDWLEMVPTAHLEPSFRSGGGRYPLRFFDSETQSVVISGYGPGDIVSFEDRPKRRPVEADAVS